MGQLLAYSITYSFIFIGNLDPELDGCVVRFNRLTAKAAHDAGFAVLEREEIERRFTYSLTHSLTH